MATMYDMCYKVDSKGKVRIWYIEQDGDKYRTWDGTQGGKIKCSDWRVAIPTNVGRSNERDGPAQAVFEIEATYKKKCEKDYHTSIESAKSGGSHIFEAMLAEKYNPKDFKSGYAQPKLDGFRCIANKDGLWSRAGKPFVSSPHIMEALAPLFAEDPNLILDGELYNHELRDNFNEISSLIGVKSDKKLTPEHYAKTKAMVQYHIYDVPSHSGSFSERDAYLGELFTKNIDFPFCIRLVETMDVVSAEDFDVLHGEWLEAGYEGSMWRNNTSYENRRTKNLLKRKDFMDEEFEVVRIEEGRGNWSNTCKSISCLTKDGKSFSAGLKGNREFADKLFARRSNPPKLVTVKYFQLTPDGIPRFPIAIKFWESEKL